MKKAFTLIELLVVIAIIAILAAILFPVFAQAKLAAKKTAALSGNKQLALAIIMYDTDFDGQFPIGFKAITWTGTDLWDQVVQPYTKSIGIFAAATDSQGGQVSSEGTWAGVGISFAANSYYGDWCCSPDWSSGFTLRGPMGVGDVNGESGEGWLGYGTMALVETQVTNPAGTVLATEKHGDDCAKWDAAYFGNSPVFEGNWSSYMSNGIIGGSDIDNAGWGPQAEPDGTSTAWKTITNGTMTQFEYGVNGAVSASYAGQSTFAFTDGHAKSMIPSATDPDPVNQPQNNMWDGLR